MAYLVDFADCLIPYSRYISIYLEVHIEVQHDTLGIYMAFTLIRKLM